LKKKCSGQRINLKGTKAKREGKMAIASIAYMTFAPWKLTKGKYGLQLSHSALFHSSSIIMLSMHAYAYICTLTMHIY
jgi:hypothetical protein